MEEIECVEENPEDDDGVVVHVGEVGIVGGMVKVFGDLCPVQSWIDVVGEVIEVVEDGVVENFVEGVRVEVEEIVIFEVWIEVWIAACPMAMVM